MGSTPEPLLASGGWRFRSQTSVGVVTLACCYNFAESAFSAQIKLNFVALFMHLGKYQFEYLSKYAFCRVPI